MSTTIQIKVNGKLEQVSAGLSLRQLLESKGINPNVVACELNLNIIKRALQPETFLNEGDELEILQMIGGG